MEVLEQSACPNEALPAIAEVARLQESDSEAGPAPRAALSPLSPVNSWAVAPPLQKSMSSSGLMLVARSVPAASSRQCVLEHRLLDLVDERHEDAMLRHVWRMW